MFIQSGSFANSEAFEDVITPFMDENYDGKPVYLYTISPLSEGNLAKYSTSSYFDRARMRYYLNSQFALSVEKKGALAVRRVSVFKV